MESFFKAILQMSLTASYVAIFVIIARLFLKKAPKIFSYLLWSVVLFRLVCPISFSSSFSLFPKTSSSNPNSITMPFIPNQTFPLQTAPTVLPTDTPIIESPTTTIINTTTQIAISWAAIIRMIWLFGVISLLFYCAFTSIKLIRKLKTATKLYDNIFESDVIATPFVLGIIKPKIYLPLGINQEEQGYIIKHEQIHIKRMDYLMKPFAFLVLTLHWFNPILWICFMLMVKDMEMSCDETVIKTTKEDIRGNYSTSLLSLSIKQNGLFVPLAFGESSVKSRIRNVLSYKKPTFWMIVISVLVLIGITIGLVSNPIVKTMKLDKTLLQDISTIRVVNLGSNKSVEFTSSEETNELVALLKEVNLSPIENLQPNNLENKIYQISLNSDLKKPVYLTLNLNKDCGFITINNDNDKPTSYKIQSLSKLQDTFEQRFLQLWQVNQPHLDNISNKNYYTAYIYTKNNQKEYTIPLKSEQIEEFSNIINSGVAIELKPVGQNDNFSVSYMIPTDEGYMEYTFMQNSFSILQENSARKFFTYGNPKDKSFIKDFIEFVQSLDSTYANPKVLTPVQVNLKRIVSNAFVTEPPYILFADSNKIILNSTMGLIYYDINTKQVINSFDYLSSLQYANDFHISCIPSLDGTKVFFFDISIPEHEKRMIYTFDFLKNEITHSYDVMPKNLKAYESIDLITGKFKNLENQNYICSNGYRIDKNQFLYLRQKNFSLIDLELVTYNESKNQKTSFYLWETIDMGNKLKKTNDGLVFENPKKAFEDGLVDYKEIIEILQKTYALKPINESNYEDYLNLDFAYDKATPYEQSEFFFLNNFLALYKKSLSYSK